MTFPANTGGRSRQSEIVTSGFDLSAAITAGGATLDFSADPLRAIDVGGAGNIVLTLFEDTVPITVPVVAGQRWVGFIKTITKVGTTATLLTGLR